MRVGSCSGGIYTRIGAGRDTWFRRDGECHRSFYLSRTGFAQRYLSSLELVAFHGGYTRTTGASGLPHYSYC